MTETLHCPNCGLEYPIPDLDAIRGRKVRCRACSHVWRVPAGQDPARGAGTPQPGTTYQRDLDKAEARASGQSDLGDVGRTVSLGRPLATAPSSKVNGSASNGANASGLIPPEPADRLRTPPGAGLPAGATAERRRLGRRPSSFDDVEAAIAALQSSIDQRPGQTAPPVSTARPYQPDPRQTPGEDPSFSPLGDNEPLEDSPFSSGLDEANRGGGRLGAAIAWAVFIGVLAGLGALAYVDRVAVVRALPGAAGVYARLGTPVNARGLEFSGVDTQWQVDGHGRPVLSLTGQVKNVSREAQSVPTVVLAFFDSEGHELFDWPTPVRLSTLPPGETAPFTTVVIAPPEVVRSVEIRFAKATR